MGYLAVRFITDLGPPHLIARPPSQYSNFDPSSENLGAVCIGDDFTVKAGLHVQRKHKHKRKHKPRVNRDDASTSARKSAFYFFLRLCLRRPGSHVACAFACAYACVVRVNQPLARGVSLERIALPERVNSFESIYGRQVQGKGVALAF